MNVPWGPRLAYVIVFCLLLTRAGVKSKIASEWVETLVPSNEKNLAMFTIIKRAFIKEKKCP